MSNGVTSSASRRRPSASGSSAPSHSAARPRSASCAVARRSGRSSRWPPAKALDQDRIDEAEAQRFLGFHHPARQDHLGGAAETDEPRQPLCAAAAGDHPQGNLGKAELGAASSTRRSQPSATRIRHPPPVRRSPRPRSGASARPVRRHVASSRIAVHRLAESERDQVLEVAVRDDEPGRSLPITSAAIESSASIAATCRSSAVIAANVMKFRGGAWKATTATGSCRCTRQALSRPRPPRALRSARTARRPRGRPRTRPPAHRADRHAGRRPAPPRRAHPRPGRHRS